MKRNLIKSSLLMITLWILACSTDGGGNETNTPKAMTDAEIVTADADALAITFGGSDTVSSVTGNLALPTTGSNGSTITWVSTYATGGADASAVIANDGAVTRPPFESGNAIVILTATVSSGTGTPQTVSFVLIVLKTPPTDAQAIASDAASLAIGYSVGDTQTSVTGDLTLANTGANGSTITWAATYTTGGADASAVIANDGTVTRPAYGSGNATITLTATVSRGSATPQTVTYPVTVSMVLPVTGDVVTNTVGGVTFNMVYVPGGLTTPTRWDDLGTPATVTNAYEIAETEVTYELWNVVRTWAIDTTVDHDGDGLTNAAHGDNDLYFFANDGRQGSDTGCYNTAPVGTMNQHPVTCIDWRDAMVWMNALTEYYNSVHGTSLAVVYTEDSGYANPFKDSRCWTQVGCDNPYVNANAKGFRLPTSNEWELAARYKGADSTNGAIEVPVSSGNWWTPANYSSGATLPYTDFTATSSVAWFGNSLLNGTGNTTSTQPVKTKTANALGLFDMSGNVSEWNFDWYGGGTVGTLRTHRGGSWTMPANNLPIGYSDALEPFFFEIYIGFRMVRNP